MITWVETAGANSFFNEMANYSVNSELLQMPLPQGTDPLIATSTNQLLTYVHLEEYCWCGIES